MNSFLSGALFMIVQFFLGWLLFVGGALFENRHAKQSMDHKKPYKFYDGGYGFILPCKGAQPKGETPHEV